MLSKEVIPSASNRPANAPWPTREAATFLNISLRHLLRLIDAGKVKTIRFGRRVFLADAEVKRLATKGI